MGDAVADGSLLLLGGAGLRMVRVADLLAPASAATNANAAAIVALTARIAAIEGRPAPIVRFTVTLTPGPIAAGTREWALKVPGVLATDFLAVEPNADLPSGVSVAYCRATAADAVELALVAALAVTAASPISFTLAALRG